MAERQIVSAQEMRQLDKLTIQEKGITAYDLMRQAGKAVYDHMIQAKLSDLNQIFLVVAGTGNNGGDALVVAKHLAADGASCHVVLVGQPEQSSEESRLAQAEVREQRTTIDFIVKETDLTLLDDHLETATVVIDGLFGIGVTRPVEGVHARVIERINSSYAKVISIDLPSGIHADNGLAMGSAVIADHTIVIQNLKQGNLLNDALDYHGETHLLDIGILQTILPETQSLLPMGYLNNKIPKRKHNSYKYMFGNVLTIGGSKGMMGAPLLAAIAALRTGSGLSHVLYQESYLHHIHNPYPDLMVDTYRGIEDIPQLAQKKSAIVFGPGLGQRDAINLDVLNYLLSTSIPLVIDADGIHYLKQLVRDYSDRPNIIITPHYKEMASFLGIPIEEVQQEPILFARNIAHTYNFTVVLKGTCTIITDNDDTFLSPHGNPGLATAGTGDVLAGIIGSLLGRGFQPMEAAKLGVLIHSRAGAFAKENLGEESMIASDVVTAISEVLKRV